jgi:hypothetical protein
MNRKNQKILNKKNEEYLEKKRLRVLEEQLHVTSKISDLCRYIGFGIAVACYSIFTSSSAFSQEVLINYNCLIALLISVIFAVLTIFFDYLQFLCGYFAVRSALENEENEFNYNIDSFFYKCRFIFFYVKQATLLISVVSLIYTYIISFGLNINIVITY